MDIEVDAGKSGELFAANLIDFLDAAQFYGIDFFSVSAIFIPSLRLHRRAAHAAILLAAG